MFRYYTYDVLNVRMILTEEKILSNIDKVNKLINPNIKRQIVQLSKDKAFKELIDSIRSYIEEYPNKKTFPTQIYIETFKLVQNATNLFEKNTKQIQTLIRMREENLILSGIVKEIVNLAVVKDKNLDSRINKSIIEVPQNILEKVKLISNSKDDQSQIYKDTLNQLKVEVANLETNTHIEVDIERLEDKIKALTLIGVGLATSLKKVPLSQEKIEATKHAFLEMKAKQLDQELSNSNDTIKSNLKINVNNIIQDQDEVELKKENIEDIVKQDLSCENIEKDNTNTVLNPILNTKEDIKDVQNIDQNSSQNVDNNSNIKVVTNIGVNSILGNQNIKNQNKGFSNQILGIDPSFEYDQSQNKIASANSQNLNINNINNNVNNRNNYPNGVNYLLNGFNMNNQMNNQMNNLNNSKAQCINAPNNNYYQKYMNNNYRKNLDKINQNNQNNQYNPNYQYNQNNQMKKPKISIWQKIKNSKIIKGIKYLFNIRVVVELPKALPEANQ